MKPIRLNGLTIETPIALGPMAGVTDLPFRMLCAEQGCGMFYTEMVSAKALHYHSKNTQELMKTGATEHPVGIQLFGEDPDIIAEEALKIEDRFDFIDINMGCPMEKVVRNGEGSILMTRPERAEQIFRKLTATVHKPVTAKIRKGFRLGEETAPEIARLLEDCGVSLIAIHGRTREEFFSGAADWNAICHVKEAVKIPVIGNGDIRSGADAAKMMEETGCDGVMVAQAAEGNPWIFREIKAYLAGLPVPARPDAEEIRELILRHARMLIAEKGPHIGVLEMRKHAAWYLSGYENGKKLRKEINLISSVEELETILNQI